MPFLPLVRVDPLTGMATGARHCLSPNCDERPTDVAPRMLVVHGISMPPGEFGGSHIEALFCNRLDPEEHPEFAKVAHLRVSAHFFVDRLGALTQFVPATQRAWHAGESCFEGHKACNDFSIGVELEGTDDIPYRTGQYITLARLYVALVKSFPEIGDNPVVGHSDIAPGRKTDPGPAFEWSRFARLVIGLGAQARLLPREMDA